MKNSYRVFFVLLACLAVTVPLSASAQSWPSVVITPDPLVFPDTRAGTVSDTLTLTATNTSSSISLYIFATRLADSTHFQIVNDDCAGKFVDPSSSCTILLAFAPAASGHYSSSISLISIGKDIINSAKLEGTGTAPAVVLSSNSLDFGDHTVGQPADVLPVTLTNSGNMALSISAIETASPFSVTHDCPASLASKASCTMNVGFEPPSVGDFNGQLTISDDAPGSPQEVALSGSGIEPGQPDIGLSTTKLDFGSQPIGTVSAAKTITVRSAGTVDLVISKITASADFAETDSCVGTLAPGAECAIDATFSPPSAGTFSGTIVIDDNATDSPQTVSLVGVGFTPGGPQVSLSVNTIDFGTLEVGSSSVPQNITLTNTGASDLLVESVDIEGDESHSFNEIDDCHGSTLSSGSSCVIEGTFSPVDEGEFSAVLMTSDNASDSPQTVALNGIGVEQSGGTGGCSLTSNSGSKTPWIFLICTAIFIVCLRRPARFRAYEESRNYLDI